MSYSQSGEMLWTIQTGTKYNDYGFGIASSQDGESLYITGSTEGSFPGQISMGYEDIFIARYTSNGEMVWMQQNGTAGDDRGYAIALSADFAYVTGYTSGNLSANSYKGLYKL